jgi:thiamine-monophosphate kinase
MPSGEDRLIERFFRPLASHPGALRLLDDAALIAPPAGSELVVTTDAIIAGVHFFPDDPPDAIAKKALRINLSDLAAKGAEPLGCLLTIALPKNIDESWIGTFADGLGADCASYGCPLMGGDTDRTPGLLSVSITAIGHVPGGTMLLRSGARPGEAIVVTGTIGDAALGLLLRREPDLADRAGLGPSERAHLVGRYLLPEPRVGLASIIRKHASAAIDISDGFAGDLMKLAAASGVAARVETSRLPLSKAASRMLAADARLIETICTGGDDYEILASVPKKSIKVLLAAAKDAGVQLTEICMTGEGEGVQMIGPDRKPIEFERSSFSHF